MKKLPQHWPAALVLLLLGLALWGLTAESRGQNEGHLAYALDDPYIHMALAKNLARHGVWGVSPFEFSSSSSSLLWTGLVALGYVVRVDEALPFVLNLLAAVGLIGVGHWILLRRRVPPLYACVALLITAFATPVPALVFTGLEHLLHAVLVLLFAFLVEEALVAPEERLAGRGGVPLCVTAALLVMSRFEGMFLVFVACVLLVARGRRMHAYAIAGCGLLPVIAYGAVSAAQGWYWLPNSVILKGQLPDLGTTEGLVEFLGYAAYRRLIEAPHLLFLVVAAVAALVHTGGRGGSSGRAWQPGSLGLGLFLATALLHLQFARTGWFYRYEAYLVAFGLIALTVALFGRSHAAEEQETKASGKWQRGVAGGLLGILLLVPLGERASRSAALTPDATRNVYEQQYQMGRFLREYYRGQAVAANDIGAVTFLGDVRILDLVGLASMDVAERVRAGEYTGDHIDAFARKRGVKVAVVYDPMYQRDGQSSLPRHWVRVGQWKIQRRVMAAYDTVSFYAADPAEAERLAACLREFAPRLPKTVLQRVGE